MKFPQYTFAFTISLVYVILCALSERICPDHGLSVFWFAFMFPLSRLIRDNFIHSEIPLNIIPPIQYEYKDFPWSREEAIEHFDEMLKMVGNI